MDSCVSAMAALSQHLPLADIVPQRHDATRARVCSARPFPPMRTSYRDVALLACCQALLLINNARLIAMNGLVGYALAESKALATLGVTTYVLGSALAAMPASLWMERVGRRRGFMTGAVIGAAGSAICAWGIARASFAQYCAGTALIGVYTAFGFQYRFAAMEVSTLEFRAKAISLVLAGGIAGG